MECLELETLPSTTIEDLPDELFDQIFREMDLESLKSSCVVCKKWLELINANVLLMRKLETRLTNEIITIVLTLPFLLRQHTNIVVSQLFFTQDMVARLASMELFASAEQIDLQSCGFENEMCLHSLLLGSQCLKHLTIRNPKIHGPKVVTEEIDVVELQTLSLEITYCWEYTTDWIRIFQLVPSKYAELNIMIYGHEWQKQEQFFEFVHSGQPSIQRALKRLSLLYSCDSGDANGVFKYVANMPELSLELFERHASIYHDPGLGDRFIQSQTSLTTLVLQHAEPIALFVTIARHLLRLKKFSFRLKCECLENVCTCFCQIGLGQLQQLEVLSISWAWTSNNHRTTTDEVVLDFFTSMEKLQKFVFDGQHARFVNLMVDERNAFKSLKSFVTLDIRIPKYPTWETICKNMPNLTLLKINDENNLNEFSFTDHNFGRLVGLQHLEILKMDGILDKDNLLCIAKHLHKLRVLTIDKFHGNLATMNATLNECFRSFYLQCPGLQNIEIGFVCYERSTRKKKFVKIKE